MNHKSHSQCSQSLSRAELSPHQAETTPAPTFDVNSTVEPPASQAREPARGRLPKQTRKQFSCTLCTKVFAKESNRKAHMMTHTGEKPFKCDICGVSFARKFNLIPHLRSHSGEKPFACADCGKRFSRASDVKVHQAVHRRAQPSPQVSPAPPTNAHSPTGNPPAPISSTAHPIASASSYPNPPGPSYAMAQSLKYFRPSRNLSNISRLAQPRPPPPPPLTPAPNAEIPEDALREAMARPFEEEPVRERPAVYTPAPDVSSIPVRQLVTDEVDVEAAPVVKPSPKKLTKEKRSSTCAAVPPRHKVSSDQAVEDAEDLALESEPRRLLDQNRKRSESRVSDRSKSSASFSAGANKNRAQSESGQETLVESSVEADADVVNMEVEPVNVPPVVDPSPPEVKKKKNQPSSGLIRSTSPELSHSKSVDKIYMAYKGKKRPMWTPSLANQKQKEPIPSTSQISKDETPISTPSTSQSVHPTSSRVAKRKNLDSHKPDEERPWSKLRTTECKTCFEDKDSEFLKCKGYCKGTFHAVCQPILRTEEQCIYCLSFNMFCFICKSADDLNKCIQIGCKKYYHVDCLRSWPQTKHIGENLICPFHVCHTCWREDSDTIPPNDQLQKCMSCPTSYHKGDDCITAGSETFGSNTGTGIWCPKHLLDVKFGLEHTSAPWCFICSKEGRLICCRYCSSSFHAECLRIEERRWRFRCPNCENGRLPRYQDIVWVKLTKQRWWPAQIPKPEEIPYDIEKLSHTDGEFCVKLFGTHGHFWVNRGRCFFFQEDDIAGKTFSTDSAFFKSAVVEAGESLKKVAQLRVRLQVEKALNSDLKPPPFAEIKTNRPVGSGTIFECLDPQGSMDPCKCKPTAEHPCGENSRCLNRLTLVECHRKVCKAHGKCENQRFGKRAYPKMHPVKTPNRGWGLRCQEDIKKGTFVCEYVGEVIDTAEHHRRVEENMRNRADDYFVSLDKTRIIDAGRKGNLARFMNHSCRPNCKTEKWTVNGDTRIGIFAIEDITSGSELTFNYLFVSLAGAEKKPCLCGADNCAGFIGANVKNLKRPKVYGKSLKAEKKKKNKDICFRCEDSGELILCDSKNCPRAYHRTCLGITILPRSGPWICPWHYCDECGSAASIRCKLCPNSFCTKHAQQAKIKFYQSENGLICSEHLSDDITESTESVDLSTSVDLAENVEDFLITDIWKCSIK